MKKSVIHIGEAAWARLVGEAASAMIRREERFTNEDSSCS